MTKCIFTVDLTLCSKYQIDGEDFVKYYNIKQRQFLKAINKASTMVGKLLVQKRRQYLGIHSIDRGIFDQY